MKKFASVLLAVLVAFSMFTFVVSAANPSVTASASKTTVKAGDEVTVTVKLSKNSGLGTLIAELNYDGAAFEVVEAKAGSLFGNDVINGGLKNKVKFVAATSDVVNAEGTVFTVKFKALKAADSKMTLSIVEATDNDYNEVEITTNTLSFNAYVEPTTNEPTTNEPTTNEPTTNEPTTNEPTTNEPTTEPTTKEEPCKNGHDYSKELVVKKPTCKEAGIAQKTCKVCGDKVEYAIEATGKCEPGAWKVVKAATTTAEGEKVQECKYCGAVLQRAKIAKLSSDPITNPAIPNTDAQA